MSLSESTSPSPAGRSTLHDELLRLRSRAEKRVQLVTQATEHRTPAEVQHLMQELQVQQIELEMQYEELLLAQAHAQAERDRYIDLYDFAPVGYFTLTPAGLVEQLNLCASQQLGITRQRLLGRRFALFVAPAARLEFDQFLARLQLAETTQNCELILQREDGNLFYAHLEGLRIKSPASAVDAGPAGFRYRLAVLDTTARRQATEALAASEARFRQLFAESSDAVVLLQGTQYADGNAAALYLLGAHHKKQLVGHPAWAYAPESQPGGQSSVSLFREIIEDALRTGSKRRDVQMRKATGEEIWVEAVLTPIEVGGPRPLIYMLWRDVTAARAAAEALRLSQERLQLALQASASGAWAWEMDEKQLYWDANAQAMFGRPYSLNPIAFKVLLAAIDSRDMALVLASLQQALRHHARFDLECRIRWPDGRVRYVAALGEVMLDEGGHPVRLTGILRDVTPRREAEQALRREKEFTESLLDNTVDGILALDRAARITAWNVEMGRYFGQEAAAVLGRSVFEVLPFLDEESHQAVARALAGQRVNRLGRPFTVRPGHYDVHLVPLKDDGQDQPSGVLVIIRDITARDRVAEEAIQLRLRQQQQVFSAIITTQETERKRIAEAIHNGLGQLLYATKLSLESQPEPPRDALQLLNEAIRTTRTISFELTPGILEDFGLRTALEELVKRIAPTGLPIHLHFIDLTQRLRPRLEIAVYRIVQELLNNVMKHADATEVQVHVAHENGRVEVSVEDNGRGFEPAVLATQPLAGIGLAGVRNRVALLGGELAINSRLGQGTIVSFELSL